MKNEEKKEKAIEPDIPLTDEQLKSITGDLTRTPEPEETEEAVGEDLPTRNVK